MQSTSVSAERKFLHDLATPMTVVRSMTKIMLQELRGERAAPSEEKQIERLINIMTSIQRMEDLHADHKALLTELESILVSA